jgi:hypothetical protein
VNEITDSENTEPIRDNPSRDTEAPSRAKLLRDREEPNSRKSNTDTADPRREYVRRAREEPT